MAEAEQWYAPFTDDQVESLNGYQKSGVFHPFTGRNDLAPDGQDDVLVATTDGWISELDETYRQNWAWSWMADWSWKEATWFSLGDPRQVFGRLPEQPDGMA